MPIDEAVRESGATIFSIAGLLKLFLSIPRGLEPSSTQVAVAACFAKRVASTASEAGRNRRTGRSEGVANEYWDRPSGLPCQSLRVQGRCSAWRAVPKPCPASDCCDGYSSIMIGRSLAVLALIITPDPLTTSDDGRRRPSRQHEAHYRGGQAYGGCDDQGQLEAPRGRQGLPAPGLGPQYRGAQRASHGEADASYHLVEA